MDTYYVGITLMFVWLVFIDQCHCAILSRNKVVTSSSAFDDWVPARIIDGNPSTAADRCRCCSATLVELNPWYQLDLGRQYEVRRVIIRGRLQTHYGQHFQNMEMYFSSIHEAKKTVEMTEAQETHAVDYVLSQPKSTQYVSVILRDQTRHFTICDLTVYGECADGEFGYYCENTCHCAGDPCNKTSGVCPSGQCVAGYQGQTCDKVCQDGYYGSGCTKTCGQCQGGATCNKVTGLCPGKCSPGYQGRRCKTECTAGSYGTDCAGVCGKCRDAKPCTVVLGKCTDGCSAGYWTEYCNRACKSGTYGLNCAEVCGNCKDGRACGVVNGTCQAGCAAGFQGHNCKTGCSSGYYGEDCRLRCGRCSNGESCNRVTGYCARGCMPGYMGDLCNNSCDDGYYGDGCITRCGYCAGGRFCNKINGSCVTTGCDVGYKLPRCTEECDAGRYGKNCGSPCGHCLNSTACNKKNGTCPACNPGYDGHDCTIRLALQTDDDDDQSSGTIIGGVVGGIVILALVIIGAAVFLRRRQSPKSAVKKRPSPELHRDVEKPVNKVEAMVVTTTEPVSTTRPLLDNKPPAVDHDYYGFITRKQELKVCQLWDYIYQKKKDGCVAFYQEFSLLKSGLIHPCDIAELAENKPKNRYRKLCAYDHCRVPLQAEGNESKYINASFINGPNKDKLFIASQGPTEAMRDDFWRMVWQQRSEQIVMLTNLVEMGTQKCLLYWPESEDVTYGNITVKLDSEKVEPDFVTRNLRIRKNTEEWRGVTQYHFRAWPDKDVPDSTWSLVKFWLAVTNDPMYGRHPVVVHCSAGIGRTGTFIALDNAYNQATTKGVLNVLDTVTSLREQRVNMVQTKEQYAFLHEALADALLFGTHFIWSSQFEDVYRYLTEEVNGTKQRRLKTQYTLIQDSIEDRKKLQHDTNDENEAEYSNVFMSKSLSTETLDEHIPKSQRADQIRELGAVLVPNYEEENTFVVSKSPTTSTLEGFWSLIAEQNIKTVIMLTDQSSPSHKVLRDLGAADKSLQSQFGVSMQQTRTEETFNESHFTYKSNGVTATLHQFEFQSWADKDTVPKETQSMLKFLEVVLDWQQRLSCTQPVLVHCSTGSERSGLVCALLNELERMKREQGHINILQSVKLMKERHEDVIPTFEQYMYIHDAILSTFAKGEMYANC